jgi:hypothetical protein
MQASAHRQITGGDEASAPSPPQGGPKWETRSAAADRQPASVTEHRDEAVQMAVPARLATLREGPTCRGEALLEQGGDGPSVTQQTRPYPPTQ